jgi:ferredoxin-type protein NapG
VRLCPIEIRISQCEQEKDAPQNSARVAQRMGNECPPKHAIQLQPMQGTDGVRRMSPLVLEGCVGCGVCEMVCPLEQTAIAIDIRANADTLGGR